MPDVPGPGHYDADESVVKYNNPSVRIGGGTQRADLVSKEQLNLPGPGNYIQDKQFGADA